MDLAQDVPQGDVDAADGRGPHDAVGVPEVLAEHHLPEVLDPRGIFADQQRGDVLDRADHGAGVPFERGFAPAPQAGLVGEHFDEHPVPHPGVADEGFDGGDFHGVLFRVASIDRLPRAGTVIASARPRFR